MIIATHLGIGLYPDSIVYIGTARSILNGDGVRFLNDIGQIAPVTQYPPLYSLMIAALGVLGLDPLDGGALDQSVFLCRPMHFLRRGSFSVSPRLFGHLG
jgi:hypothetical protein